MPPIMHIFKEAICVYASLKLCHFLSMDKSPFLVEYKIICIIIDGQQIKFVMSFSNYVINFGFV